MFRSLLIAAAAIAVLAPAAAAADTPDAEIFATDNTALITDADDPRLDDPLAEFARAVERIVDRGGGEPRGSQLLDGVFFSSDLGGTTFERSRRFDVDRVSDGELHAIADRVRRRFLQQSVLTFDHLRRGDREVDAILLEVPGVSAQALRDGLLADPEAQERLFGGSVTLDGRLLLVAALEDAGLAREFAQRIGGDLNRARTSYGEREFVEGASPVRIEDGTLLIEGGDGDDRVEIEPDGDRLEIELGHESSWRGWTRSSASAPISAAAPTPSRSATSRTSSSTRSGSTSAPATAAPTVSPWPARATTTRPPSWRSAARWPCSDRRSWRSTARSRATG